MKLKDMSERRYTEKELIEIFKAAMNRQDVQNDNNTEEPTFTLDEIERIGKEAGIAPDHLRNAAKRVHHSVTEVETESLFNFMKTERWVNGKLSEEQIENFFAEMRQYFGRNTAIGAKDELKKLGHTYEMQMADTNISLSEKKGGYLVSISNHQFFSGTSVETVILGVFATVSIGILPIGIAGEFLGNWWAFAIAILVLIISLFGVKNYTSKQRQKVNNQTAEIADKAEELLSVFLSQESRSQIENSPQLKIDDSVNENIKTQKSQKQRIRS